MKKTIAEIVSNCLIIAIAAAFLFPVLTIFIHTNYLVPGNYIIFGIILAVFGIGYSYAKQTDVDPIASAAVAMVAFFILTPFIYFIYYIIYYQSFIVNSKV